MQIVYEKVHKPENISPLDRNCSSNNYIPEKEWLFEKYSEFYPISHLNTFIQRYNHLKKRGEKHSGPACSIQVERRQWKEKLRLFVWKVVKESVVYYRNTECSAIAH